MITEYGNVKYIWDTEEGMYVYAYGIVKNVVKAAIDVDIPRYHLIRQDKFGDDYFKMGKYRVYLNQLQEIY